MIDNVPGELRLLDQWVVSGPNKEPLNPRTGQPASVTDPSTWATFYEARQAGYQNVGFVLTPGDPYAIIDLDAPVTPDQIERHKFLLDRINSYTEVSQSGNGFHIVVRGAIPHGVRRHKIEMYSAERYMIFTGNVTNWAPITDYQATLDEWFEFMGGGMTLGLDIEDKPEVLTDAKIIEMATNAVNGEKFNRLWSGMWDGYQSQSEADLALMTMFCFYSKNDDQVRRLFRMSGLGKREKAQRDDYLNYAIGKIRVKQYVPPVDLGFLLNPPSQAAPIPVFDAVPHTYTPPPPPPPPVPSISYPPGLVGELAEYIYSSAIRPVHEVALCAAIGLMGGIVGRQYNVSSTGLNQYVVLLAKTGTGKEGAASGIDAVLAAVREQVPAVDEFMGPGTFASGQALHRVLDTKPCFVSVLGEVGLTLQQVCAKNAASHLVQLRKVLLAIYGKSGWNNILHGMAYSDTEKSISSVKAPAVTILGESTPENFYGALDSSHITEGLIPRFLVIEYLGDRVPENTRAFHRPRADMVARLVDVCQTTLAMRSNDSCCPVQKDDDAFSMLEIFNVFADDQINGAGNDETLRHLWNRAHLKVLKLAALVAVGCNSHQPIITGAVAAWAIEVVKRDIANMTVKFSSGETGQEGDHRQELEIRRAVEKYGTLTTEQRLQYRVPKSLADKGNVVPLAYLRVFAFPRAAFKNDRRGANDALKNCLAGMVSAGILQQVSTPDALSMFQTTSPLYYRGESF